MNQDWGQVGTGQPALRWVGYLGLSSLILAGLLKASEPFLPRANNDWEPSHQNVTVIEYRPLGVANSNASQDGSSKPLPDAVLTEVPPELVAQLQAHEAMPIPIDAEAIEEEEEEEEQEPRWTGSWWTFLSPRYKRSQWRPSIWQSLPSGR